MADPSLKFVLFPGVYLITKKGIEVSGCGVGIQNIALAIYSHDLQVTDLAINFFEQGYEIITEKEILANRKKQSAKPDDRNVYRT